jgi:hypothetical protein
MIKAYYRLILTNNLPQANRQRKQNSTSVRKLKIKNPKGVHNYVNIMMSFP